MPDVEDNNRADDNFGFPKPPNPIHDDITEEAAAALKDLHGRIASLKSEPVSIEEISGQPSLQSEIEHVLNKYSAENGSGTPDFILAEFLMGCLESYNKTVRRRAQWNGYSVDEYGHEVHE